VGTSPASRQVKRLGVLLEAFAALLGKSAPQPVLILWGGFPGEAEGEHPYDTVQRLGLDKQVYFIGWRSHDELPIGLNSADLMVAPAVNESFGMVYVEAQACGTPPIATNTGGPVSIITGSGITADGWLVSPDDPRELADTLAAVLADPAERSRRAANGIANSRLRYSWPVIADQYQRIYDAERR
jgi:glycosyltransferase involved in cell wall biosynthesis